MKSTCGANAAAFRAAAGTSTMIPTRNPAGVPRPATATASSSRAVAASSSATVLIIGNIRSTGWSCATRTIASS